MKNFKRKLAGLLVFAMVLGIMAPGVVAHAATEGETEETKPTVEIYVDSERAYLDGIKGYTVKYAQYMGTASAVTGKSAGVTIKDSAWETLEKSSSAEDAWLDLSWAKKNKDSAFVFEFTKKGVSDPYYVVQTVKAQPKAIKVGIAATTASSVGAKSGPASVPEDYFVGSPDTGYLYFYDTSKNPVSPATITWRKGSSEGSPVTSSYYDAESEYAIVRSLKLFMAKGATLYFTVEGTSDENGMNHTWPSKEAKFSYKKQANGPKVTVDVSKYTVGLKVGQEYKVITGEEEEGVEPAWIKVTEDMGYTKEKAKELKKLTVEALWTDTASKDAINLMDYVYGSGLTLKVRTAAGNGKVPSKTTTVELKSVSPSACEVVTTDIKATTGVAVSYITPTKADSGVALVNKDKVVYQYALVVSGKGIDADTKWYNLKAEKTVKIKPATLTKVGAEVDVLVRVPGQKANAKKNQEMELAGNFARQSVKAIPVVPQSVTKGAVNNSLSITNVTTAGFTVSGSAVSGKALEVEVTFEVENYQGNTKNFDVTAPSGVTVKTNKKANKVTVEKGGKATLQFTLAESKGATGDITIKIEEIEVKITLQIADGK